MKMQTTRWIPAAVAVLAAVTTGACSSATPTDTPGVDRVGEYILRQKGPEVEAYLGYRFAGQSIASDWLILEVALTSPNGQSADVKRANVFVRTPDGTKVPMATQEEFGKDYGGLRSTLQRAYVARDPMDYFTPSRVDCGLNFFTSPGGGVVFDELSLNDRRGCQGQLFFKVPGGIQQGRWTFGIDLDESEIRIPFTL